MDKNVNKDLCESRLASIAMRSRLLTVVGTSYARGKPIFTRKRKWGVSRYGFLQLITVLNDCKKLY